MTTLVALTYAKYFEGNKASSDNPTAWVNPAHVFSVEPNESRRHYGRALVFAPGGSFLPVHESVEEVVAKLKAAGTTLPTEGQR